MSWADAPFLAHTALRFPLLLEHLRVLYPVLVEQRWGRSVQLPKGVPAPDDAGGRLSAHVVEPARALVVAERRIRSIWDLAGYLGKLVVLMLATTLTMLNETERAA
ncbi:hypothetical protein ACFQVD_11030 [Streptosporangium amethystogenes subsp. fukuiense]|uniref:Uncharacterized protein n=1 Tax=Streptosporangium amethystogenes subsp. fukuiense TaxID=698418 RepID=A0ABW2SWG9_9ACTN